MKTKTHFTFRVDIWDDTGDSIVEYRFPAGTFKRITRVLEPDEVRTDFVYAAVERELRRRESKQ
jgi:hypothetical protein